ncbi:helix-turn-helix domain-containing protein [Chromobacterium haemolyticum]|uniref:helix-turn-helix domain-containing protein n=1 Tax=Chromobacterium haemolyticum TaxID=394935 RepID=UPI000593C4C9|nr:helix-turn-helix transcriptional regulator [Chromobacterium haemolyticum]
MIFYMTTIGERVRIARARIGWSQGRLASEVGITQPTVSDLERGDSDGTKHIVSIAKALGVRARWLETGEGEMLSNSVEADSDEELVKTLADKGEAYVIEFIRKLLDETKRSH